MGIRTARHALICARHQKGLTLIELMVGIVIMGILLALGAPNYKNWIQSSQIRTLAESMANGLQIAKSTAVNRNTPVRFQLTSDLSSTCILSTTGSNWIVSLDNPAASCNTAPSDTVVPRIVQLRSGSEGTANAVVNADITDVTFNGLGRATNANGGSMTINVMNPTGGNCTCATGNCGYPAGTYAAGAPMHCMRVLISSGGQVRMCDPALAASDPQGC